MHIRVIEVGAPTTDSGKNGKQYQRAEFKFEANGKTNTKKLVSFDPLWGILTAAKPDDEFEVKVVKEGDFYKWLEAKPVSKETTKSTPSASTTPAKAAGSTYETAAERAVKQELIVRQSSLTFARSFSEDLDEVFQIAQKARDWVYGQYQPTERVE